MSETVTGSGTADDPWVLRTPPGTSEYQMHRDDSVDPPELVCQVGSTKLRYLARCLDDVPAMLREHGDWMDLGGADENKPVKPGTLEAWARADDNPVGGWYGLRKGYRGRFAMYVPAPPRTPRPRRARARTPQQPHPRPQGELRPSSHRARKPPSSSLLPLGEVLVRRLERTLRPVDAWLDHLGYRRADLPRRHDRWTTSS